MKIHRKQHSITTRDSQYHWSRGKNRCGSTLIIALVCMVILSALLLGNISNSIRHRRQLRNEHQLEQTQWVLDAGIGIALTRFETEPELDEFTIDASSALDRYSSKIVITPLQNDNRQIRVRVTAQLKSNHEHGIETSRSKVIVIPAQVATPSQSEPKPEENSDEA